ncbi:hypothetical protein [Allopontixanthobacter sp.]|uniref:hypothetical protein n=1 Tax=Allopontixanthobacter sp. TaxID=2906452 RepID=UPI002AB98FD1|nr:hypothetical protein [Allopontixanthobacter sp.]MDZ4307359.1 hypothetical protein [Allopontixanthobacter sp.]
MAKALLFAIAALVLGGCDQLVDQQMQDIHKQVAQDATDQYDIAKRQGDLIQICVQAGLVAASYLQAKDEANYNSWKLIEDADCAKAGMP